MQRKNKQTAEKQRAKKATFNIKSNGKIDCNYATTTNHHQELTKKKKTTKQQRVSH